MNEIAHFIKEYLPILATNRGFYMIPCLLYGTSVVFHLLKFINHTTPRFTRMFCLILGFSVSVEFTGTLAYVLESNGGKLIDGVNVQWMIVMLVGGMVQLLTPFGVSAAESFYLKKLATK